MTRAAAILDLLAENGGVAAGPASSPVGSGSPSRRSRTSARRSPTPGWPGGDGFTLGRKLAELGGAYLASVDLIQEFYDACHELEVGSDETIQLAVLDGSR